jgi:hypothetical protein
MGNEGAGKVIAIGEGVSSVKVGDRVILPFTVRKWQQRVLVPAEELIVAPPDADGNLTQKRLPTAPDGRKRQMPQKLYLKPISATAGSSPPHRSSAKNVCVVFGRVNAYLHADLDRHGISAKVGETRIFATLHEAIDAARSGRSAADQA